MLHMRTRTSLAVALATVTAALPVVAQSAAGSGGPVAQAAHDEIVRRTPAAGSTARNVKAVSITFSSKLVTGKIDVYRAGERVAPRSSGPSGATVKAAFATKLARGRYTVKWRAVASDGHLQTGSWSFNAR